MPWKSLNLSKLNNPDQTGPSGTRFAPLNIGGGAAAAANKLPGQGTSTTNMGRRQRCYRDEDAEEDLEEASRLLSIDDFAPNFTSQKPVSPVNAEG